MKKEGKKRGESRVFTSDFYNALLELENKYRVSEDELVEFLSRRKFTKDKIPVSVLGKLSGLESIVKYLRENCALGFKEIGGMLGRSKFTVASSYRISAMKLSDKFVVHTSEYDIPTSLFADRKYSVLEHIVVYLKDNFELKYSDIAKMLGLNQKTVWTVYKRAGAKKK